jgi:glycosyltransferase involved in cell wall biosynthesis
MRPPIHIGFLARDFLTWGGGVWFIQNLLRGLATLSPEEVRITVLVPSDHTLRLRARRFAGRLKRAAQRPTHAWQTLFGRRAPERELWLKGVEQLTAIVPQMVIFDGSDEDMLRQCARLGIDALLPVMTPPAAASSVPWVGYLYDCQHKHFPQFFSPAEIARRDQAFAEMLRSGAVVFANAQSVIADLRRFFPDGRAALHSLPFAPLILEDELTGAARDAQAERQDVTGGAPYFIVCNQFWVHKDHATAFRAFATFTQKPERSDWRLVCTGLTDDYRVPGYFSELTTLVAELGIADRVIFTGYIEKSRQQALLYGAEALVQPTLFEGGPGGGSASDAIALGVTCLLSDIAVNRELTNPLAAFFRVGDSSSLASAMEDVASRAPGRPPAAQLLRNSDEHARHLGQALLDLAQTAFAASHAF